MKAAAHAAALLATPSVEALAFQSTYNRRCIGSVRNNNNAAASPLRPRRLFAATTPTSDPSSTTTKEVANKQQQQHSFDSFDYNSHWYPVTWSRDVPLNQPIRVTLFDVDYVLAKTKLPSKNDEGEDEEVLYAMVDQCPHKKVALSEGRITDCGTPDKRYFQCSYHGKYHLLVSSHCCCNIIMVKGRAHHK